MDIREKLALGAEKACAVLDSEGLQSIKSGVGDTVQHYAHVKEIGRLVDNIINHTGKITDIQFEKSVKDQLLVILNGLFVDKSKIRFVDDRQSQEDTEYDIPDDWFTSSDVDVKTPFRMFDVETRNMVSTFNLGLQDQYCVVSHSWKGSEIDYQYFADAKTLEAMEGTAEGQESSCQDSLSHQKTHESSDLDKVIEKSKADITVLEHKVASALTRARPRHDGERPKDIETLLQWYIDAKEAESGIKYWQKEVHNADALRSSSGQRAKHYQTVMKGLVDCLIASSTDGKTREEFSQGPWSRHLDSAITELTEGTSSRHDLAVRSFDAASKTWAEAASTTQFFNNNLELRYGAEALLAALQRIRSTRKIEQSIVHAKELFNAHFPGGGNRYVWLDTCCINKRDSYELTESLALMGDWYANADFCLVHLDTPRSEQSWIEEWKHWKMPSHVPVELNIERFTDIGSDARDSVHKTNIQVEWATRGWTLQELVLSKMTYFVNSYWHKLERPVEALGPFYHLAPFIKRYMNHPFVRSLRKRHAPVISKLHEQLLSRFGQDSSRERRLFLALEEIGFVPPNDLRDTTAQAQIGRAVHAAARLSPSILDELAVDVSISDASLIVDHYSACLNLRGKIALINDLLHGLSKVAKRAIIDDRERISRFSNIGHLKNWVSGTGLLNSSASNVLITAAERQTTVPTDKAYSLMGILGVRFPAFPAEGLPKALARLLDEVVITYNDVSVFNWTGKHCGSPLHGRSLYPASINAFVDQTDDTNSTTQVDASQNILKLLRSQRARQIVIAGRINDLLVGMLKLTKKLPAACSTVYALGNLANKIRYTKFEHLDAHLDALERIVEEINHIHSKADRNVGAATPATGVKRDTPVDSPGKFSSIERIDGIRKSVLSYNVPRPKLSFRRKKSSPQAPEGEQQEEAPDPKEEERKKQEAEFRAVDEAINFIIQQMRSVNTGDSGSCSEPSEEGDEDCPDSHEAIPLTPSIQRIIGDSKSTDYNNLMDSDEKVPEHSDESQERRLVCPNPIVVSSGGIRGIFDIQRIIVKMIDPDRLRSRIKSAVPGQKIEGWCTISTGLTLTLVSFTCEAHVLAKQLDIMELIAHDIDPDEGSEESGERDDWMRRERYKVSRMVSFVQDPDLHGIAGEWVLARFSGSPGARWFLCQLELGAGNELYGRRIATDAFSFENAAPEKGLMGYWYKYSDDRKNLLCDALKMYVRQKRHWRDAGQEVQNLLYPEDSTPKTESYTDGSATAAILQELPVTQLVSVGKIAGNDIAAAGFRVWAEYLDGRIKRGALNKVPVHLQTPIMDFDGNKTLLPAMFHAGREVHMF